jgi:hypothetical protein
LPRVHAGFLLHPAIRARAEKAGCHGEHAAAGFPRAARDGFHYSAVAARADGKSGGCERATEFQGFHVIGMAFLRARTPEDCDDSRVLNHDVISLQGLKAPKNSGDLK